MPVAFFDVDGTIVRGSTGVLALDVFRRAGYITYWHTVQALGYHVLHRAGFLDAAAVYRKAIVPFVGRDVAEVDRHLELLFRERVRPAIFQRAVALVQEHHARGDAVVLLSGSSRRLLNLFDEVLPVTRVLAFVQKTEGDVFIDDFEEPIPYGASKILLAERFVAEHGGSLVDATYYADSISDLPLLERVGTPKPVNPDLRLRRAAEKRGWPILRFHRVLGDPPRPHS